MFLDNSIPLIGTPGISAKGYIEHIRAHRPSALTITPALVEAIAAQADRAGVTGVRLMEVLFDQTEPPFIACGGAPTDVRILRKLADYGVDVYEGYGLSENSSVVSWNRVDAVRLGTVGKPLPHVDVMISACGELLVKSSSMFAGYANDDPTSCHVNQDGWLCTGDLATIDDAGFISIIGRKKNVAITANGRNISPEWVESRYRSLDFIENVVIFGDGLEEVHGVFIVTDRDASLSAEQKLRRFGASNLSDIERVDRYHIYTLSDVDVSNCFTITGRPQRDKLWNHLEAKLKGEALC